MDLTKQKRVVSRANSLATKLKNMLVTIYTALTLAKRKPTSMSNSSTDVVEMIAKCNANTQITKKKKNVSQKR